MLPAVALMLALTMGSCSQYSLVNSQVYNGADLAAYRTFRIVVPGDSVRLAPGMTMVTYYNIAAAIREQMDMRGYVEDPASPLVINMGITVSKDIATEPLWQALGPGLVGAPIGGPVGPPYPYYGRWWNGCAPWFMYPRSYYWPGWDSNAQVITGIYREGVLTVDMFNWDQKLPLFTASVATILDNGDSQFRTLKGIAQAVNTLFEKFPVKVLPQYRTKK